MAFDQLPRMIGEPDRAVQLRQAVVVGNPVSGKATIQFGTGATAIAGVRMLAGAGVTDGDAVFVLQQGYDLLVLGQVAATPGSTAQFGDGLELYHPSSTPYIDFHRGADPAGDANADYSVRLILEAAGRLAVQGNVRMTGQVNCDWTGGDPLRVSGGAAGVAYEARDNAGRFFVWYANADMMRLWNNATSEVMAVSKDNWGQIGEAALGTWSGGGGHAKFSHSSRRTTGELAFFQRNDGCLWVGGGPWIQFECNTGRNAVCYVDTTGGWQMQTQLVVPSGQRIRTLAWNDGNHEIHYLAGNDVEGPEIMGWGGVQLFGVNQDARVRLQYGNGDFVLYDNGGGWSMKSISSGAALKLDVAPLEGALEKVRRMRPVYFKRKYNDARPLHKKNLEAIKKKPKPEPIPDPGELPATANAKAIAAWSKAKEAHHLRKGEIEQDAWDRENAQRLLDAAEDRWAKRLDPAVQRPELGFVAEELEQIEPGLVTPASPHPDSMGIGIMYGQVTALLAKAIQELDARLDALEAPPLP